MSTVFESAEEAKEYVVLVFGLDPKKVEFQEIEGLKVGGMETMLLDDPETDETTKQAIRERLDAQKGFKFNHPEKGEIQIAIGPFRDGFDCWIVGKNGFASRL